LARQAAPFSQRHPVVKRIQDPCLLPPDCVQVVIALIVTPEGFPLAYEVMPGNTLDKTTLNDFLKKIENQYGRYDRIWIMDRGIPTEETLTKMREASVV